MAYQYRHLVLFLSCSLLACTVAKAGGPGKPELNLRFTVFCPQRLAGIDYVVSTVPERKTKPLQFYMTARSPIYEYRGAAPLEFVDEKTGETVARADIPAEMKTPLLIFFPNSQPTEHGLRFRMLIYDDSLARLSAGGLAVLNLSEFSIFGTIDREKVELAAGYSGPYKVGRTAKLQLRTLIDQKSYHTYGGTITLGKDGRALLILLPPFYKGSLEVQSRVLLDEMVAEKKSVEPKK